MMKILRLLILAGLAFGLLPQNSLADNPGRPCAFDPVDGFEAPNGSGACFDDFGFLVAVVNENDGFVLAGSPPGADNQWFRQNPNGKGKLHAVVDVPFFVYCSPETNAANACNPFSGEAFEGLGTVQLNTALDAQSFSFTCPLTARLTGIATDGFGNTVEVVAALTQVPDGESGCRATVNRIDASPVLD
jgi:hypothetical protein